MKRINKFTVPITINPYMTFINLTNNRNYVEKHGGTKVKQYHEGLSIWSGFFNKEGEEIDDTLILYLDTSQGYINVDTICHECLHISWYILERAGVSIDVFNHEALAYLQQNLVNSVLSVLLRKKIKIKLN